MQRLVATLSYFYLFIGIFLFGPIRIAIAHDLDNCRWFNRHLYISECAARSGNAGLGTGRRQGLCIGEMVCSQQWGRTVTENEKQAERQESPGVYPVHCEARITDRGWTCAGKSISECFSEYIRSPTLEYSGSQKGVEYIKTFHGPGFNNKNGPSKGEIDSDIPHTKKVP